MFSSEATGGCSTFRFLETGRGGIIELYWYKETCTCSDPKNRVSKHEVHKPPIHDEGLSFLTKLGITAGDLGSPVHLGNDDKGQGDLTRTKGTCASSNSKREEFRNMKFTNHQYMTKIFHFQQKKLGITEAYSTFSMAALKTNILIWRMFMVSSMKAAIHLGPNYLVNLEVHENTNFEEIPSLFDLTQKLILENVNSIESTSPS